MKRFVTLFVISALLLSVLSGCWNRRELNEMSLAVAMAVDKSKKGYHVSVQVVNPSQISNQQNGGALHTPVSVYSASGKTLFEAIRKIIKTSSRKTYFGHLRLLIFSKEIAKEGVGKTLDMIWRDQEFRSDFFMVVSKTKKAKDILQIFTPVEKIPANHVFQTLEVSEKAWAPTVAIDIDEFIEDLLVEGKNPVLGGIQVHGNKESGKNSSSVSKIYPDARLVASDIALFKKDKLVGWLNVDESKGYNYILGNVKSTVGFLECPGGGNITMEVIRTEAKIKGNVVNHKPKISISLKLDQNIADVECDWDISKQTTIKQIEKESAKKIIALMDKAIKKAQKEKTDVFGFGSTIHKSNPKEWAALKKNWDQEFTSLEVDIKVETKIRVFGKVNQSLLKELEE
ncbi:Ger(x)C family spore germination protein [Fictibacillus nanhaiensis]|uniref:Ger(x)C family spore germination protein n=1 Tax=Fictibacillus nanhaiensis TaxID=742169 RepID=UPI001C96F7EC|nr:Ger(x)C family spore germination protein [Fictibacillus nanhaiensis]MBY6037700.1 Ger(x)C family spore germination protein [Fictibacillus nanhaiensis]